MREHGCWLVLVTRRHVSARACHAALTSPLARSVFIRSRNPESNTLDSSMINAIFSFLQPERLNTVRRSSSKSSPVYFLCTYRSTRQVRSVLIKEPRARVRNPPLGLRSVDQTHLNLVHAQTIHPGHKTGQGGFSRSADANQKQVALRLAEYSETLSEKDTIQGFYDLFLFQHSGPKLSQELICNIFNVF